MEEAYNIHTVSDKILYFDLKENMYKPLTQDVYESILNGNIRL